MSKATKIFGVAALLVLTAILLSAGVERDAAVAADKPAVKPVDGAAEKGHADGCCCCCSPLCELYRKHVMLLRECIEVKAKYDVDLVDWLITPKYADPAKKEYAMRPIISLDRISIYALENELESALNGEREKLSPEWVKKLGALIALRHKIDALGSLAADVKKSIERLEAKH